MIDPSYIQEAFSGELDLFSYLIIDIEDMKIGDRVYLDIPTSCFHFIVTEIDLDGYIKVRQEDPCTKDISDEIRFAMREFYDIDVISVEYKEVIEMDTKESVSNIAEFKVRIIE